MRRFFVKEIVAKDGSCMITGSEARHIAKALRVSEMNDLARFECVEPVYNLLTRDIDMELLPLCASEGMGVCVFNPLAGEMLTGKHEFGKPPAEGRFTHELLGPAYLERYWSAKNFEAVDKFKQVAKEHGCSLPQFALAWILSKKTITSVLSGTTAIEQLEENLKTLERGPVSDEERRWLERVGDHVHAVSPSTTFDFLFPNRKRGRSLTL